MQGKRRFTVERCDECKTLVNGHDHTWDVVDRTTGYIVFNADTRDAARLEAHNRESEAIIARFRNEPPAREPRL